MFASLTLEALERTLRRLEADGSQEFWSVILRRFHVSKVAFSKYLPDDQYAYRLAAVPELGSPPTLILPERLRRELPPLPSILDLVSPGTPFSDPDDEEP